MVNSPLCHLSHAAVVLLTIASAATLGCSKSTDRLSVEGNVTFDGSPVAEGTINFMPLPGTDSPTAGATIRDGHFSIPADKGLKSGEFEVTVKAVRSTGKQVKNPESGEMMDEFEAFIPDRYNTKTELRAQVKPGEKNIVDFELTSH